MSKFECHKSYGKLEVTLSIDKSLIDIYTDYYLFKLKDKHYKCIHRDYISSVHQFRLLIGAGFASSNIDMNRFTIKPIDLVNDVCTDDTLVYSIEIDARGQTEDSIDKYLSTVKELLRVMSDKSDEVKLGSHKYKSRSRTR